METLVATRKPTQAGLQNVLVAVGPTDSDRLDRLVEETVDVAGPTGATVVLAHIFSPEDFEDRVEALGFDRGANDVSPDSVAVRYSVIREFANRLDAEGIDYEVRGTVGVEDEGITALAEESDADRILVGGRKRSPTGKAVFGSLAQQIMLSAPCPVTFVRADTE
ncbi:universal stress protein uspa-like protein [Halogeometricum pallidum JCM 14848]|uniref:Universal stress protein uspa-like protein n=1 Tax=Halogeometricum pallidum JCM 14848 TaxID=1227487 RepID=M0DK05_HALPD|nr:universal stress protein [Halogeometricum pallidum]ELZ35012.1 universal stress protein uspa-like protein [Halogeometricum pallidum JCM 14848]